MERWRVAKTLVPWLLGLFLATACTIRHGSSLSGVNVATSDGFGGIEIFTAVLGNLRDKVVKPTAQALVDKGATWTDLCQFSACPDPTRPVCVEVEKLGPTPDQKLACQQFLLTPGLAAAYLARVSDDGIRVKGLPGPLGADDLQDVLARTVVGPAKNDIEFSFKKAQGPPPVSRLVLGAAESHEFLHGVFYKVLPSTIATCPTQPEGYVLDWQPMGAAFAACGGGRTILTLAGLALADKAEQLGFDSDANLWAFAINDPPSANATDPYAASDTYNGPITFDGTCDTGYKIVLSWQDQTLPLPCDKGTWTGVVKPNPLSAANSRLDVTVEYDAPRGTTVIKKAVPLKLGQMPTGFTFIEPREGVGQGQTIYPSGSCDPGSHIQVLAPAGTIDLNCTQNAWQTSFASPIASGNFTLTVRYFGLADVLLQSVDRTVTVAAAAPPPPPPPPQPPPYTPPPQPPPPPPPPQDQGHFNQWGVLYNQIGDMSVCITYDSQPSGNGVLWPGQPAFQGWLIKCYVPFAGTGDCHCPAGGAYPVNSAAADCGQVGIANLSNSAFNCCLVEFKCVY